MPRPLRQHRRPSGQLAPAGCPVVDPPATPGGARSTGCRCPRGPDAGGTLTIMVQVSAATSPSAGAPRSTLGPTALTRRRQVHGRCHLSIGLPVYNGERYLEQSVDALLGQTFGDFELILCSNASTDATDDICRRYEREDERVRFVRQRENVGAAPNHTRVVVEARAPLIQVGLGRRPLRATSSNGVPCSTTTPRLGSLVDRRDRRGREPLQALVPSPMTRRPPDACGACCLRGRAAGRHPSRRLVRRHPP